MEAAEKQLTAPKRETVYTGVRDDLKCGDCGAKMVLRESKFGPFYGCTTYPKCKGTHGAHKTGKPFGTPANKDTRRARIEAHRVFDAIWKQKLIAPESSQKRNRHKAYSWLRVGMKLTNREAHISQFTKEQCETLKKLVHADYPALRTRWSHLLYADDFTDT